MDAIPLTEKSAAGSIGEIVSVIGDEASRRLCERLGGITLEIQQNFDLFEEAIGREAANALRAYWGAGRMYIPRKPVSRAVRRAEVLRMWKEGRKFQEIALLMKVSERRIYQVVYQERTKGGAQATPL